MPELPEVDFARRALTRWIGKSEIERVTVADPRILDKGVTAKDLVKHLEERRVQSVTRRGKWLRFELDRGLVFSHLGMTGKWVPAKEEPVRFEKLRLQVKKGGKAKNVAYLDPRIFGRFVIADTDIKAWTELGPDPLVDGLDAKVLVPKLARRSLPIKVVLLDQGLFAGIGNIQATEALFFAKIDPRRKASSLTKKEVGALIRAIDKSIARTLDAESGPTITYVEEPGADNPFAIYGRAGEKCPRCRTKLAKITQVGRTTAYCPTCQS